MNILELLLERDVLADDFSLGRMYVRNVFFGETGEDKDRQLETNPEGKVHGQSAIPRGRYRITTSLSQRFGRELPILEDVPGFSGIRVHGGNGPEDTEGCILLGRLRGARGPANCAERVASLVKLINDTEANGAEVWITVK